MEQRVKYGTYPVTMAAANWINVLTALGAMRDEYLKLGFPGLAEDVEHTRQMVESQVMENRT